MKFIIMLFLALTLSACSRQPSEENIKQAVQTEVNENNAKIRQMEKMFKSEEEQKTSSNSKKDDEGKSYDAFDKAFSQIGKAIENVGSAIGNVVVDILPALNGRDSCYQACMSARENVFC